MLTNKKYFRVHRETGKIFEFASLLPDAIIIDPVEGEIDPNNIDLSESSHSYWVHYVEVYEEYEEDSVKKARWTFNIDDVNYGNLESLVLGAIYRPNIPRLLPAIDFSDTNPNYFIFDLDLNEWKSPLFELDGIKIWNTELKQYVGI